MRERRSRLGGLPEWPKGADCKSAGASLRWFESTTLHTYQRDRASSRSPFVSFRGRSSVGRASAFQAERRRFESDRPLVFRSASPLAPAAVQPRPEEGPPAARRPVSSAPPNRRRSPPALRLSCLSRSSSVPDPRSSRLANARAFVDPRPGSSEVEHLLGKEEVVSSILILGSIPPSREIQGESASCRKKSSFVPSPT